ncbi:MAG TPA: AmmeMemoRadiSam system protein A [Bacillota bacterium]
MPKLEASDVSRGIVMAGLSPHPPIIVPEVGQGEVARARRTREALQELARRVKAARPDTVIIISPHAPVFRDATAILAEPKLEGSFSSFGAGKVAISRENDLDLVALIEQEARKLGQHTVRIDRRTAGDYGISEKLDHGVLVPLYYLDEQGVDAKLVAMAMAYLPYEELFAFGQGIARAARESGRRVVLIASGDLSHRLLPEAPAGYDPEAKRFDQAVEEAVEKGDVERLLGIDADLIERAGECGYRPIVMLFGALDGRRLTPEVLSYEGPFGVGYMVASFAPGARDEARAIGRGLFDRRGARLEERRQKQHPLVRMARETLEGYVRDGRRPAGPSGADLEPWTKERAGAFVSLHKHGELRGCIGTTEPTTASVVEEIAQNAISAGTHDPRFDPVEPKDLDDLEYSVDVLKPAEPISGLDELDPERYGVIVQKGGRSGLLLPHLEGIHSAEEQVRIARQKAGIAPSERDVLLFRFEVERFH